MAGLNINTHHGPKTFVAEEKIVGGQIVVAGTNGGVKVAAAEAETVLGVALTDAAPSSAPVDGVLVAKPEHTSVAYGPVELELDVVGAVALGDKVGAAAGGKAIKHTTGDVVGVVTRVLANNRALVRLK